MSNDKTIFGEDTPGDNYENVSPGIGPATGDPIPLPTRNSLTSSARPIYGFTYPDTMVYGIPSVTAYMAPDVPDGTNPWKPTPYVPFVPSPNPGFVFPTPDVLGDTMKELQNLGLNPTDALRLLAICDWECKRALEITKACRKDCIWDILQFARELMGK